MPAVCGEFSPSLYLPAPEFPHIDGKTVSAQILSEMNLGVYEMHGLIKGEKKVQHNRGDNISQHGFGLLLLQLSSCIVAERL